MRLRRDKAVLVPLAQLGKVLAPIDDALRVLDGLAVVSLILINAELHSLLIQVQIPARDLLGELKSFIVVEHPVPGLKYLIRVARVESVGICLSRYAVGVVQLVHYPLVGQKETELAVSVRHLPLLIGLSDLLVILVRVYAAVHPEDLIPAVGIEGQREKVVKIRLTGGDYLLRIAGVESRRIWIEILPNVLGKL